jgi:hypothetical protein
MEGKEKEPSVCHAREVAFISEWSRAIDKEYNEHAHQNSGKDLGRKTGIRPERGYVRAGSCEGPATWIKGELTDRGLAGVRSDAPVNWEHGRNLVFPIGVDRD